MKNEQMTNSQIPACLIVNVSQLRPETHDR